MPVPTPDELRTEYARLAAAVRSSRTELAQAEAAAVTALTAAGFNRAAIFERLGLTASTQRDRMRDWPADFVTSSWSLAEASRDIEVATSQLAAAREARGAFIVYLHDGAGLSLRQVATQLGMGDAYLGRIYRAARPATPRQTVEVPTVPAAAIRAWASRQGLHVATRAGIALTLRAAYVAHKAGNRQPLDRLLEDQAIRAWAAREGLSLGTHRGIPRKTRSAYWQQADVD